MIESTRRGRKPNSESPKVVIDDQVIALAVYNLVSWGVSGRSSGERVGAFEAVGVAARNILRRTDSNGCPLGPDRIEQIFEKWFKAEQAARRSSNRWPLKERWRYTKESLGERIPDKRMTVLELAEELLKNKGKWGRRGITLPAGDLILSPKADRILGISPKFVQNGVIK